MVLCHLLCGWWPQPMYIPPRESCLTWGRSRGRELEESSWFHCLQCPEVVDTSVLCVRVCVCACTKLIFPVSLSFVHYHNSVSEDQCHVLEEMEESASLITDNGKGFREAGKLAPSLKWVCSKTNSQSKGSSRPSSILLHSLQRLPFKNLWISFFLPGIPLNITLRLGKEGKCSGIRHPGCLD